MYPPNIPPSGTSSGSRSDPEEPRTLPCVGCGESVSRLEATVDRDGWWHPLCEQRAWEAAGFKAPVDAPFREAWRVAKLERGDAGVVPPDASIEDGSPAGRLRADPWIRHLYSLWMSLKHQHHLLGAALDAKDLNEACSVMWNTRYTRHDIDSSFDHALGEEFCRMSWKSFSEALKKSMPPK